MTTPNHGRKLYPIIALLLLLLLAAGGYIILLEIRQKPNVATELEESGKKSKQ